MKDRHNCPFHVAFQTPPGWRFQIDENGYEDIWYDPAQVGDFIRLKIPKGGLQDCPLGSVRAVTLVSVLLLCQSCSRH
jgi:hypothetical protein